MNHRLCGRAVALALALVPAMMVGSVRSEAERYIKAQRYAEALHVMRPVMARGASGSNAELCKWYGQALCMTGRYAEAVPYLERAKGISGAWWYLGITRQHLYQFDAAIEALETYKKKCRPDSPWIARTDSIIAECSLGQRAVAHVADVVVIDSLEVPAGYFFQQYMMGCESGRLLSAEDCSAEVEALAGRGAAVFENPPADTRIFASADSLAAWHGLYQSHRFGGAWETPQPVPSVGSERFRIATPWQRSDGETLYFACDSTPGLGGLDLYVTTFDSDADAYRAPQRLGMPFNSPFDDYMMAIDETHHVGWWATNRSAPEGFVTIYLFAYDDEPDYLDGPQPERGRLASIRATWRDGIDSKALAEQVRNAPQQQAEAPTLRIPIDDQTVYHSADDFRRPDARIVYQTAVSLAGELAELEQQLDALRVRYHGLSADKRPTLAPKIVEFEQRRETLRSQLSAARKAYRNLELQ